VANKRIKILCGPSGSARAARMDGLLRDSMGSARLLVPSRGQARIRRDTLLATEGCPGTWGAPVLSLTDFAEQLVSREGISVTRMDSSFQQRLIMEHCLAEVAVELPETMLVRIPRTPGLIRHLVMVVNDLKQAAIEPETFAERIKTTEYTSHLDEGVAAVYALYQEMLLDQGLYDVPGLYWHADQFATEGRPRILEGVTTLLWDGFDDFTPSEFRLLRSLVSHVDEVVIGLNLDQSPDRQDRYALPRTTLQQLREHFDCQVIECEAPEVRSHAEYAARHIFWREEPTLPEGIDANLTLMPCSDSTHELECIARRVKKLIVEEGVRPADIAIIFWNLRNTGGALRGVFASFGIPCQLAEQRALAETVLGRTLINLFAVTDWEREAIVDLLHATHLGTKLGPVPEAAAYYARRAQILDGYKNWDYRLKRLKGQLERDERDDARALLARRPDAIAELDTLLIAIERLQVLQQQLPAKSTQHDYAALLDILLAALVLSDENPLLVAEDEPAREGIYGLLEMLADAPGSDVVDMTRDDFLARITQGMEELSCTLPGTMGGVVCLDANQARNQRFAHVFVGGMNEGQAPATPSGNAVYPERDRERLQEAGIPIESNQAHHARQRMLFGHILECAGESLTLSWQLMQDSGREASASPFLTDVRELFPESVGVVAPYPKADSFLAATGWIASSRDLVNRTFYDAPDLAVAFPDLCTPCAAGVSVEAERHSDAPFGPFDGALSDPALVAAIAADYGEAHEFSVNQLETWLSCPFNFYVNRILKLEESEAPDTAVGPLIRGGVMHRVLQDFHQQFAGLHIRDIGLPKADEVMESLVEAAFEKQDWSDCAAPRGAVLAEKLHMQSRMRRYLRIEHAQEKEQGWKPLHFEVGFGRAAKADEAEPSNARPFVMQGESGPVRFTGRIDRIDRDGIQARLIDYKSGTVPGSGDITRGDNIQLSVYAEAVEQHLLPGSQCTEARYLSVGKTDRREALGIGEKRYNWPMRVDNMHTAIDRAVEGIRSAYFPPERAGNSCFGCGHARACRHEDARIARKTGNLQEEDSSESDG
jgi:ATP-dependent helicase/DNAse subunit B